jgi:hypothetical protein
MVAVGQAIEVDIASSVTGPIVWTRWPTVVDRGGGAYEVWTRGVIVGSYASFVAAQAAARTSIPGGVTVEPLYAYTVTQLRNLDVMDRLRDNWQRDGQTRAPTIISGIGDA